HHLPPATLSCHAAHPHLHSFPTRRSSDLTGEDRRQHRGGMNVGGIGVETGADEGVERTLRQREQVARFGHGSISGRDAAAQHRSDRKSTRLNSSHGSISYAVFCSKKKMAL